LWPKPVDIAAAPAADFSSTRFYDLNYSAAALIYASLNEMRQTFGSRSLRIGVKHSPVRHVQQVQASQYGL